MAGKPVDSRFSAVGQPKSGRLLVRRQALIQGQGDLFGRTYRTLMIAIAIGFYRDRGRKPPTGFSRVAQRPVPVTPFREITKAPTRAGLAVRQRQEVTPVLSLDGALGSVD